MSGDRTKFLFEDDETHALIINDVQETDMGVYVCRAVNKVGEATSSTTLNITGNWYYYGTLEWDGCEGG